MKSSTSQNSFKNKLNNIYLILSKLKSQTALTNRNGYTLVEMIVVFGVSATLLAISIGSYSTYNKIQQFNQSAISAQLLISQARGNAQSVVKTIKNEKGTPDPYICAEPLLLTGYRVVSSASNILDLVIDCQGTAVAVKSVKFQGDVVLDTTLPLPRTTCVDVRYESLTAKLTSTACDYVLTDGTRTKTIRIDSGGNVSLF